MQACLCNTKTMVRENCKKWCVTVCFCCVENEGQLQIIQREASVSKSDNFGNPTLTVGKKVPDTILSTFPIS